MGGPGYKLPVSVRAQQGQQGIIFLFIQRIAPGLLKQLVDTQKGILFLHFGKTGHIRIFLYRLIQGVKKLFLGDGL